MKTQSPNRTPLYITGLATQYPSNIVSSEGFEDIVKRLYPKHIGSTRIQKLIAVNKLTGISSRPLVSNFSGDETTCSSPPPIDEISRTFREIGVDLAVSACKKALLEAQISASEVTHTVAVTCTDTGNPGYDILVTGKLDLDPEVDRTLLHGVGCAGGLAALRTAANMAAGAAQRGIPARVLVFACELCSLYTRCELQSACDDNKEFSIGPVLFSDAAAALVVCNELGLERGVRPVFELLDWNSAILPGTLASMSYLVEPDGYHLRLSKCVPENCVGAIMPMYKTLESSFGYGDDFKTSDCDWAMHPGGIAILRGAQQALNLFQDQLRASFDIYQSYGNSSSPTILIVLDRLRNMGYGRDRVIATSFGPGLRIEMFTMKRCRSKPNRRLTE
ncbi:chalcone synthase B [Lojkania enalia]|uniref:Chalcone synthase B n=1 Tax=Lojkania enalia TaxID=147567 RepID=A0A9P4KAV5_9PLEO|nr:chalcone synthase B [Didymosphaeria enalia]